VFRWGEHGVKHMGGLCVGQKKLDIFDI